MAQQKVCHFGRDGITRCGQPAKFVIRNYFRGAPLKAEIGSDDYYACESCSRINPYWRLICSAVVWEKLDRQADESLRGEA